MQEKKINTFRLQCLRRTLGIAWQQKITNGEALIHTSLSTMYFYFSLRKLFWLGNVLRMGEERIPKSLFFSELVVGTPNRGRPKRKKARFKKLEYINWWVGFVYKRSMVIYYTQKTERKRKQYFKKRKPKQTKKWKAKWIFSIYIYYFLLNICVYIFFLCTKRMANFGW